MRYSLCACAAALCLVLGTGPVVAAGPEGSWYCLKDATPIGTMGVRPKNYVLIRSTGPTPGEYQATGGSFNITSGPLKDEFSLGEGTLDEANNPRTISFASGAVVCKEVQ